MLRRWSVKCRENDVREKVILMGENGHVTEVVTLMEGEWSCYGGGQFKGGRMVML